MPGMRADGNSSTYLYSQHQNRAASRRCGIRLIDSLQACAIALSFEQWSMPTEPIYVRIDMSQIEKECVLPMHCPEELRALLWAGPESQLRDRAASLPWALLSIACPLAAHRPLLGSQVPQFSGSHCVQLSQNWGCCCRGQLSGGFAQQCLVGSAFRQCTACSWAIVQQYRQGGWLFILQALQVRLLSCSVFCVARSPGDVAALPRGLQESSTMRPRDAMLIPTRHLVAWPGSAVQVPAFMAVSV